ncbi:hypothetical protein JCM19992_33260 [Thermostilla marina]
MSNSEYPKDPTPARRPAHKLNCWEFFTQESDSRKCDACPVRDAVEFDGINGGTNGGRACWAVPKARAGNIAGPALRSAECAVCPFYQLVACEEMPEVIDKRRNSHEFGCHDDLSLPPPVVSFVRRSR